MAIFPAMLITEEGQTLYNKALAGTPINFTKIKLGSGRLTLGQDQTILTQLIDFKFDMPISSIKQNTLLQLAVISGRINNDNIETGTYICELGLFAQDPDVGEILYAYTNADDKGDYYAPASRGPFSWAYQINAAIGNASNVSATLVSASNTDDALDISSSFTFISGANQKEVNENIDEHLNTFNNQLNNLSNDKLNAAVFTAFQEEINSDMTDMTKIPAYAATTGSASVYAIALNPAPTSYIDGMGLTVKINADSTGATTINVNSLGAKSIKNQDGTDLGSGDLKTNGIYNLRYNATTGIFILQGKGGDTATLENLIDSYVVSSDGNLNAGDLCEFINGQVRKTFLTSATSSITQINSVTSTFISAVLLDSTHVLIAYCNESTVYLNAVVLTISGNAISIGTIKQVNTATTQFVSASRLDSTHVLVTYRTYASSTYYFYSIVLTISGTTITTGTATQLDSNASNSTYTSTAILDSTHAIISYVISSSLYCVVVTISGTTITKGTAVNAGATGGNSYPITIIDSTHALLIVSASSSLSGRILTISGTTITLGTSYQISAVTAYDASSCLLDSTHALVTYDASSALNSVVLTISGTTITVGTIYQISASITVLKGTSSILIDSTHVLVTYVNSSSYVYSVILTISGATITVGSVYQVNSVASAYISAVLIDSTHVLISYEDTANSNYLKSVIIGIDLSTYTVSNTVITHALNPIAICTGAYSVGNTARCGIKGIFSGLSGLTPGATYYCDNNGNLTTTVTLIKIGVALSSTELLIKKAFWER